MGDSTRGGKTDNLGQQKRHAVRDRATGQLVNEAEGGVTQADWKDKGQYPRDKFERVDGVDDDAAEGGT
jgi:hypothetical protein